MDIQTNKTGATTDEVSEEERALAGQWEKRIKAAKRARKETSDHIWSPERIKMMRNYVNGKQHDDGATGLVRTNLIYSTIATLLPYIYAKNPDISVSPAETVEPGQYKAIRAFGKTLEIVLRRSVVVDGKLKKRMKSTVRSVLTTGAGWIKATYQREYRKDPIIQGRIADTQDNIARIEMLMRKVKDNGDSASDHDAHRGELQQQLAALEQQVEVTFSEGMVYDRALTEDIFVLDDSLRDFDTYLQARAISHRIWFRDDLYAETFGADPPDDATTYKQPKDDDGSSGSDKHDNWYAVFEIWDKVSQTVYTKCDGSTRWCRPPYQPQSGERWYPFFGLAYNLVDGQFEPLPDVMLLKELQDEYNTTRTNFAEHRKESLPGLVFRKGGGLTEDDVGRIINRKINEAIGVEGDPGRPISDDLMEIRGSQIDPQVYDVSAIRNDMDLMAGLTDASRSNLTIAKTLGEAEIMKESMMSRTAERQDMNEDFMQEICQFSAEILIQELTEQQVMRIAGPGYTWPKMSKEDIFDMVRIDIRAGSTGKPNKQNERQQWIEFMPTFQDMAMKVIEMRQAGNADMANAMTEMMKETLRRFDERLDIETFIPAQEEGKGTADTGMQLQEMQQQMAQMQEENQKLQEAADANQTKLQIEGERIQSDNQRAMLSADAEKLAIASKERISLADANTKAVSTENIKNAEINANREIEQERIESNERIEMAKAMTSMMQQPETPGEAQGVAKPDSQQLAMSEFNKLLSEFMRVMSADRVAVRDQAGRLVRTRIDVQPNQ